MSENQPLAANFWPLIATFFHVKVHSECMLDLRGLAEDFCVGCFNNSIFYKGKGKEYALINAHH